MLHATGLGLRTLRCVLLASTRFVRVVTRHTGPQAYQQKKTIGTLAWLWYVRATGTLSRPADQLLHYPIPDTPADGFDKEVMLRNHEICLD